MRKFYQRIAILVTFRNIILSILIFGIFLRIMHYLSNRSIWMDESFVALTIMEKNYSELLNAVQLGAIQKEPIGFLVIEKIVVQLFGNSEYVLRVFPLLCGIISLFLFCKVARYFVDRKTTIVAFALFAVSFQLIYYSSEVKPYSCDVTVGLFLYVMTIYLLENPLNLFRSLLFGFTGGCLMWLSHPSLFILAGIGCWLIYYCVRRKEFSEIGYYAGMFVLWFLSFVFLYFLYLKNVSNSVHLLTFFSRSFMPLPPTNVKEIMWFPTKFIVMVKYSIGCFLPGIAAVSMLVGCFILYKKSSEEFFFLVLPLCFALLASGFQKYPFEPRLLLFGVPLLVILIAEGGTWVFRRLRKVDLYNPEQTQGHFVIGFLFVGLLVADPIAYTSGRIMRPSAGEIRPVIRHVEKHWLKGDLVYVFYSAESAFDYYSKKSQWPNLDFMVGVRSKNNWHSYAKDLDLLRGRERVWILFCHNWTKRSSDEEKFFVYYLDTIGIRLQSFKAPGAAVYLYNLKQEEVKHHLPGAMKEIGHSPEGVH